MLNPDLRPQRSIEFQQTSQKIWQDIQAYPEEWVHLFIPKTHDSFESHIRDYLDITLPGWEKGAYIAQYDRPSTDVSCFLRFFGNCNNDLRRNTKDIAKAIFSGHPEFVKGMADTLDLIENIDGKRQRRTGEPVSRHPDRVVVRHFAKAALAQKNNSSFPSRRPFDKPHLSKLFTSSIALTLHDCFEDHLHEGYYADHYGNKLRIWKFDRATSQEAEVSHVDFSSPEEAIWAIRIITGFTTFKNPEQSAGDLDTEDKIRYFEDFTMDPDMSFLRWFLNSEAKRNDRDDNISTYWDPDEYNFFRVEQRLDKFTETLDNYPIVSLPSWMWEHGKYIGDPPDSDQIPLYPPSLDAEVIMRLLGATLDDIYTPVLSACAETREILDQNNEKYLVVPDPFQPVIITTSGFFYFIDVPKGGLAGLGQMHPEKGWQMYDIPGGIFS